MMADNQPATAAESRRGTAPTTPHERRSIGTAVFFGVVVVAAVVAVILVMAS